MAKQGNVLFNDALNTFYLQLYGVGWPNKLLFENIYSCSVFKFTLHVSLIDSILKQIIELW